MKPLFLRPLLCALPLVSLACLENEEEITVRPDGSLHVKVSAKGDVADLAQGYPVPLAAPWRPVNDGAREWLTKVGGATGGAVALARIGDERVLGKPDTERELAVEADFASVGDLPARCADPADPYADAYLERSASLQVIERGSKTIYVFERTLHARPYGRAIFERMWDEEEDEQRGKEQLLERFQEGLLTEEEWNEASRQLSGPQEWLARACVREAMLGLYTHGSAALTSEALKLMLDRVDQRVEDAFSVSRLKALPRDAEELDGALTRMHAESRDAIREEVVRTLAEARISSEEQNAVAFALEREFTAYDHSVDVSDETFEVSVTLPGELVTGNFESLEYFDPKAYWKIEGHELLLGDVTLRAVSVVE